MKKIKALYVGENSNGYENSHQYTLILGEACGDNCSVNIAAIGESFTGSKTYSSMNSFLESWDNIRNI